MLTIKSQRYESDGRLCGDPIIRTVQPSWAFTSLVRFELGFGGVIIDMDIDTMWQASYLVVRTSMMGRYDEVRFSGPADEMSPLATAAHLYMSLRADKDTSQALVDIAFSMSAAASGPGNVSPDGTVGASPLMLKTVGMMALGSTAAKQAALYVLERNTPAWAELAVKLPDDEFFAVCELVLEDPSLTLEDIEAIL